MMQLLGEPCTHSGVGAYNQRRQVIGHVGTNRLYKMESKLVESAAVIPCSLLG